MATMIDFVSEHLDRSERRSWSPELGREALLVLPLHNMRLLLRELVDRIARKPWTYRTSYGFYRREWQKSIRETERLLADLKDGRLGKTSPLPLRLPGQTFTGRWTDHFSHVAPGRFYIRESRYWMMRFDGYVYGHDLIDALELLFELYGIDDWRTSSGSPANANSFETRYDFLDGGLRVYSGNYMFCQPGQGAYIVGYEAFRWVLERLGLEQPRRLKGELECRTERREHPGITP